MKFFVFFLLLGFCLAGQDGVLETLSCPACGGTLDPVCGSDGTTYWNEECALCLSPELTISSHSFCPRMVFKNKPAEKSEKTLEVWEVLDKFGMYQILQYLFMCLPTLVINMGHINYVFVVKDVPYRCRIPECEGPDTFYLVDWWPNKTTDRCLRPALRNTSFQNLGSCRVDSFGDYFEPCEEWVYENYDSVVSVLNLACKSWHINAIGAIHNLGILISMMITGWVADRFGRKPILVFSMVISSFGLLKIFASSYYVYLTIEFLEALLGGGSYSVATVLMIEITGRRHRILSGVIFAYSIYMGESIFAILAMFVRDWKTLTIIIYTPTILCLCLIYLLHESPRWLILNGKTKDAIIGIEKIARTNRLNLCTKDLTNIDADKLRDKFKIENYEAKESFRDIFRSTEMIKRLIVASLCRFTSNFVYYGIMINSVWLPGDKYVNFLLSTVMSFPGELISLYLMNKIGRKIPLIVGFILCGALCIVSAFVPETVSWAKILLFLSGKVVVSACFTGAITYCMELFPTSARGSLLGLCSFSGHLGGMLAPLTPILYDVSVVLPALCFGASSLITGLSILATPETKHSPLMDTIHQVDASVRNIRDNHNVERQNDNKGFQGE